MALNDKQRRFVDEYLVDLNATQAAIRAGYSPKTAGAQAFKLLKIAEIQQAIQDAMKALEKRTEITQDMVLRELARVAFGNKRNLMRWGPGGVTLLDSEEIGEADAAMVSEVSETTSATGGSIKLKTHDKVKALELLGKHLGMFSDKLELTGKDGGPVQTHQVTAEELAEAVRSVRDDF